MHDIYIEGGTKRQRDIADKVISFCIQRLMPKARSLNVELTLTKDMTDLGGCWLLDNHRSFGIEVHKIPKDPMEQMSLLREKGAKIEDYTNNKDIFKDIEKLVIKLNGKFSNPEQIKKFSILPNSP